MNTPEKTSLQYPNMRVELIEYLKELADPDYQERFWIRGEVREGLMDGLDFPIDFLFDDTRFADDPERTVGVMVYDEREMTAVVKVVNAIDAVFDDIGLEATDEIYVRSRLWPGVIAAASEALRILGEKR